MSAPSAALPAGSPGLEAIQSLLIPGERLETHAIQRRLFALTHRRLVVGATSGRLIAVRRGLISGFTTEDVRWQDLHDAQLQVGIFGATLTVSAGSGADLAGAEGGARRLGLRRTPKGPGAGGLSRLPVPGAGVAGEAPGARAGGDAGQVRRRAPRRRGRRRRRGRGRRAGARSPQARLQRAKEMLDQGLLTDAEYEQVKARILGEL